MRASIVMAARNEGQLLIKTVLSCLESINEHECEIVVADNASTDGSIDRLAQEFPQARIVQYNERRGPSPTKNFGAAQARGEVLVFLDAHCMPHVHAIRRLIADVEETAEDAIITPQIWGLDVDTWQPSDAMAGHGFSRDLLRFETRWVDLKEMRSRGPFFEAPNLAGGCLAISRTLYDKLRGFDAGMLVWGSEDVDLGLKSWLTGHPILHDPKCIIGHRFQTGTSSYPIPMQHVVVNEMRSARKNFTGAVWRDWLYHYRASKPDSLWRECVRLFAADRESLEQERSYLLEHRVHDEFWYADRFDLGWPLSIRDGHPSGTPHDPLAATETGAYRKHLFESHSQEPRHFAVPPTWTVHGSSTNDHEQTITFYLKLARDRKGRGYVQHASFETNGGLCQVACGSLVAHLMQRRSLTQVRRLAVRNLLAHFGDQTTVLASARSAITAVQNALKSI